MRTAKSLVGKTTGIMIFLTIFIIFIVFLKQTGIVNAQNSSITGYEILNDSENYSQNITQGSEIIANDTEILGGNENLTENIDESQEKIDENFEISNETMQNETSFEENVTETDEISQNLTENETSEQNVTEISNETEIILKNVKVELFYPKKITRGETITVRAIVNNFDALTANNVAVDWEIPAGFSIIFGEVRHFCGNIAQNGSCVSEISLKTDVSTTTGLNRVKAVVNYE
jgi:hypothetical protein